MFSLARKSLLSSRRSKWQVLYATTTIPPTTRKKKEGKEKNDIASIIETWESSKDKGTTLVIVESPAKARTIQKFVDGDRFIVDSCAGHVRDLPRSGVDFKNKSELKKSIFCPELKLNVADMGVDVNNNFEPVYVTLENKIEVVRRLQKLSEQCSRILLATDEDREGEAISWHLVELLQPKVPYKRAVFHEITKSAILHSFEEPRDIDMNLVGSQETRRILDRLAGYTVSPVLWRYVAPGLSAGRVQSCGLYLITQREKKRWQFSESQYFSIKAALSDENSNGSGQSTSMSSTLGVDVEKVGDGHGSRQLVCKMSMWDDQRVAGEGDFDGATGELRAPTGSDKLPLVLDKESAQAAMLWLTGRQGFDDENMAENHIEGRKEGTKTPPEFSVANVDTRKGSRKPPAAFITSTLQQECSRKLRMSPSRCMSIAQELYEEGWITYMRTDSPTLSEQAYNVSRALVGSIFGEDFLSEAKKFAIPVVATSTPMNNGSGTKEEMSSSIVDQEPILTEENNKKKPKKGKKDDEETTTTTAAAVGTASANDPAIPKNAQLAHEAIRPAELDGTFKTPAQTGLEGSKKLLYSLIYRRTLASVMKPSQALTKTYTINAQNDDKGEENKEDEQHKAVFRASETVTTFKGHLAAMEMSEDGKFLINDVDPVSTMFNFAVGVKLFLTSWRDVNKSTTTAVTSGSELGELMDSDAVFGSDHIDAIDASSSYSEGDNEGIRTDTEINEETDPNSSGTTRDGEEVTASAFQLDGISAMQHVTRPPSRFSEASFIKELETIGVGRPSTYSKIFQILREREYLHVDKQTLIPTVKGMVVAEWLEKHFPDLVEAKFTAHMEHSLDKIARGEQDKLSFLSDFYLGEPSKQQEGLLARVAQKLERQEIDHKESRTLEVPFLSDLGVLQLGRSGAFIERRATMTPPPFDLLNQPLDHGSEQDFSSTGSGNSTRWKLPEAMQIDLREITREAVEFLISNEQSMQGAVVGTDPESGRPVTLRSGRFGKYLQIGADNEKNKTTHSVPQWLTLDASFEDILAFTRLPKHVCQHPTLNVSIIAEVTAKELCVGVQGYPLRIPLPADITAVSQITEELATSLLINTADIVDSQRTLGEWRNETVIILKGRFGYYIRCGKLVAGLRKLEPSSVTFEDAIQILETRGKLVGSKKKGKGKKEKKQKTTTTSKKGTKSGYQIFVAESMAKGNKMAEAASAWKNLDATQQQEFKDKATQLNMATAASSDESTTTSPKTKKTAKEPTAKTKTGYQIFVAESMKQGNKMGEAASAWKNLDATQQQEFKDKAMQLNMAATASDEPITTPSKNKSTAKESTTKTKTGYQIFVAESMKQGNKMGEAASAWKNLDAAQQQEFKDKASGKL